ncbi:hypothetical protein A2U01_0119107, partial [Trifolium medium]|nr:hypothetical protein [Trifolium medium]
MGVDDAHCSSPHSPVSAIRGSRDPVFRP